MAAAPRFGDAGAAVVAAAGTGVVGDGADVVGAAVVGGAVAVTVLVAAACSSDGEEHGRPDRGQSGFHPTLRMRPSCITDTTSRPSRVKIDPDANPRDPNVDGVIWS